MGSGEGDPPTDPSPDTTDTVEVTEPAAVPRQTPVEAAVEAFRAGLAPLLDALNVHLRGIAAGDHNRRGKVSKRKAAVIPLITNMMRRHPVVQAVLTPDEIDAHQAGAASMRLLALVLESLTQKVDETGRLLLEDAWTGASEGYTVATQRARRDGALDRAIAPVRKALRKGPRERSDARAVTDGQQKAQSAQVRAARAQWRAEVARKTQSLAAQVHALKHPGKYPRGGGGTGGE